MACHKYLYPFLFFQIFFSSSFAQKEVGEIFFSDINESIKCKPTSTNNDTLQTISLFSSCLRKFHEEGYLEARIDSITFSTNPPRAYAYKGTQFKWAYFEVDSNSRRWLSAAGIKPKRFNGMPIKSSFAAKTSYRVLSHLQNNGFPFATIQFKNTSFDTTSVSTRVKVLPGPLITLDTLYVKGDVNVSQRFLESYLGFSKGEIYRHDRLSKFDERLRRLGFVSIIRSSEIEFIPGKARVYTYVKNRPSSQFSGLVGFFTDEQTSKIKFTGDVNLRLVNAFRSGERSVFQWQALGEGTQRLNIATNWPYLAGSNLGVDAHFKLYRRDTSYISINPRLAFQFYFPNQSSVGVAFDHRSSTTIANDVTSGNGNFRTTLYQVSFTSGHESNEFFPSKEIWFSTTAGAGVREVTEYDTKSNKENSTVGELQGLALLYYPVFSQQLVVHVKVQGEIQGFISSQSQSTFFVNEMFRIGGINTLRGFNQESIVTNAYAIASAELQYRIQRVLNMYAFFDRAIVNQQLQLQTLTSWPFGVGFGFQIATAGGLLNLSYALGNGLGEELKLRNAKIHVGFTASF